MKRILLIVLTLTLPFIGCRAPSDSDDPGWNGPVPQGQGYDSAGIGQFGPPTQSETPDLSQRRLNQLLFVSGMYCGRLVTPNGVEEDLSYCRAMADEVDHSDGKSPEEILQAIFQITQDYCGQGDPEYPGDQRAITKKMHCDLVRMMQGRAEAGRDQ